MMHGWMSGMRRVIFLEPYGAFGGAIDADGTALLLLAVQTISFRPQTQDIYDTGSVAADIKAI